eukprot:407196-Hanusia_phi.AAC.1
MYSKSLHKEIKDQEKARGRAARGRAARSNVESSSEDEENEEQSDPGDGVQGKRKRKRLLLNVEKYHELVCEINDLYGKYSSVPVTGDKHQDVVSWFEGTGGSQPVLRVRRRATRSRVLARQREKGYPVIFEDQVQARHRALSPIGDLARSAVGAHAYS